MLTVQKLDERITRLEKELVEKDVITIRQAERKLSSDLGKISLSKKKPTFYSEKNKNLEAIFLKIFQIQNLLELSIADATPQSIDQLALGEICIEIFCVST